MTNTEIKARAEKAIELHSKGYNCAQAVACTFCDKTAFSEEQYIDYGMNSQIV